MLSRLPWLLAILVLACSAHTPAAPPQRAAPSSAARPKAACTAIADEARSLAGRYKQTSAQAKLLEACDSGVPACCHEAALQHRSKIGYLTHSEWRAQQLFAHACELGSWLSCREIGKPEHLDRACMLGDAAACAEWKAPAIFGLALHAKGCELGDPSACRRHAAVLAPLRPLGEVQYWSMRDPRYESVKHKQWGSVVLEPFAFTASGRHVFAHTYDQRLAALDARTGEVVAQPSFDEYRVGKPTYLVGHRVGTHLFFSADLRASDDGPQPTEHGVFLRRVGRDGDTGWQRLQKGAFHVGVPSAFSWDGRIAAGTVGPGADYGYCPFGVDGVQRWDVATGKALGEAVPLPAGVTMNEVELDLSPDGQMLAVGGEKGPVVEVWRANETRPFASFPMEARWVRFSADGVVSSQKAGYASGPRTLANLELSSGQLTHVPDADQGASLYAPDADLLVFKGDVMRFFDRLGRPLADLEVGTWGGLGSVLTSPDGKTALLASASMGILRVQREPAATVSTQDDELAWFRKLRLPLRAPDSPLRSLLRDCGEVPTDGEVVLHVSENRNTKISPLPNRLIELRTNVAGTPVRGVADLPPRRARTDRRGHVHFTGLARVTWTPHLLDAAGREGSHSPDWGLELAREARIERAAAFRPRPKGDPASQPLTGSVKRPDGRPAAGALIEGMANSRDAVRQSVADAQGRFGFDRHDVKWVRASLPDGHYGEISTKAWSKTVHPVIELRAPGSLGIERLRFVDDQGTPLPPDVIRKRFGLMVDEQGRALDPSCPKCAARCDVSRILRRLRLEDVAVTKLDDVCELRMPSASIRLETKGVFYYAYLRLLESKRGVPPWLSPKNVANQDGTIYEWTDLPSGHYELKLHDREGGERRRIELDLAPGQILQLEVPPMVATAVSGQIIDDETGLPLTGFTVEAGRESRETKSDAQGRFKFEHIGAGSSLLRVGPGGLDTLHQREINVELGVPLDLGTIRISSADERQ